MSYASKIKTAKAASSFRQNFFANQTEFAYAASKAKDVHKRYIDDVETAVFSTTKQKKKRMKNYQMKKKGRLEKQYIQFQPNFRPKLDSYKHPEFCYFTPVGDGPATKYRTKKGYNYAVRNCDNLHVADCSDELHGMYYDLDNVFVCRKMPRKNAVRQWGRMRATIDAMGEHIDKCPQLERGKKIGVIKTMVPVDSIDSKNKNVHCEARYVGVGLYPEMYKHGILERKTEGVSSESRTLVQSMMQKHREMLKSTMPYLVNKVFKNLKKDGNEWSTDVQGDVDVAPSMVIGESAYLSLHKDNDSYVGVVSVHCKDDLVKLPRYETCEVYRQEQLSEDIIAYFVVPGHGIKVPMRSGDVLIFNPKLKHCLTEPTVNYRKKIFYCCSSYLKSKIVGLNSAKLFDEDGATKLHDLTEFSGFTKPLKYIKSQQEKSEVIDLLGDL